MTVPEYIRELGYDPEDIIYFTNPSYDSAFVGISTDGRAIYDFELMVKYLVNDWKMTEEEAQEFIQYNTVRALPYIGNSPIIIQDCRFNLDCNNQE